MPILPSGAHDRAPSDRLLPRPRQRGRAIKTAAPLHAAELALESATLAHTSSALVGDPTTQLATAAAELDLLVCGSRGRGRRLATLLGSVSSHLVAHAPCPVLVVPPTVARGEHAPLGIASARTS